MLVVEMISGMIIGEIRIVIIVCLLGMWFWLRLIVVSVLNDIDMIVVIGVMISEFLKLCCYLLFVKKLW